MSDLPKGGAPAVDPEDEIPLDLELEEPEPELDEDSNPVEEEPEPELDEEGNPVEPEPAAATPPARRGSPRVQSLVNENRALKARQADFERQLAALTAQRAQPSQAEIAAAQEQERQIFEMKSPWEQAQHLAQTIDRRVQQRTNEIAQGIWDQQDKRTYDEELRASPQYRRYDERVEELRKIAPGVSRVDLLDKAIGEYARTHGAAARTRATRVADAGAVRNGARPAGGRGDVPSERGRGGGVSARDARLRAAGLIS